LSLSTISSKPHGGFWNLYKSYRVYDFVFQSFKSKLQFYVKREVRIAFVGLELFNFGDLVVTDVF
jgi:hypothetical protein